MRNGSMIFRDFPEEQQWHMIHWSAGATSPETGWSDIISVIGTGVATIIAFM